MNKTQRATLASVAGRLSEFSTPKRVSAFLTALVEQKGDASIFHGCRSEVRSKAIAARCMSVEQRRELMRETLEAAKLDLLAIRAAGPAYSAVATAAWNAGDPDCDTVTVSYVRVAMREINTLLSKEQP